MVVIVIELVMDDSSLSLGLLVDPVVPDVDVVSVCGGELSMWLLIE